MVHLTSRFLLLALAVVASIAQGSGESTPEDAVSDIPCVGLRTVKACEKAKATLLSHCVWCESKAVPSQCVTPEIAEKLPKLVFKCDDDNVQTAQE